MKKSILDLTLEKVLKEEIDNDSKDDKTFMDSIYLEYLEESKNSTNVFDFETWLKIHNLLTLREIFEELEQIHLDLS